jgi:hypothetical protein
MAQIPMTEMTTEQLAGSIGPERNSFNNMAVETEFLRRQTVAQIRSAKYMLWSVIAIAITSGLNALFAFLSWYAPHLH